MLECAAEEATIDGRPLTFTFVSDTAIIRTAKEFEAALLSEPMVTSGTLRVKLGYEGKGSLSVSSGARVLLRDNAGSLLRTIGIFRGTRDSSLTLDAYVTAGTRLSLQLSVPEESVREYLIERIFIGDAGLEKLAEAIPFFADEGRPTQFKLYDAYPNPFNPSTTIRYALPEPAHVSLIIFNTVGEQVATLVDDAKAEGYHEVQFDASGLASGVYLYRLTAGSFVETRKLVFVR